MNQTLVRRARLVLGMWRLLRVQSRLCRWSHGVGVSAGGGAADGAPLGRWMGKIRIGNRSEHALFCPPSMQAIYRLPAPPRTRVAAWCGLLPGTSDTSESAGEAEFEIRVRSEGRSGEWVARLRMDPRQSAGYPGWTRLVLDLHNAEAEQIELTLTVRTAPGSSAGALAVWGEPV